MINSLPVVQLLALMHEHFVDSASVHEHSRMWFPRVLSLAPVWTHNGKRRHQSFATNAQCKYWHQCEIGLTLNNASVTRGNSLKLLNQSFHYDLRKYSFPAHVVNIWNSLPNVVVLASSPDTVHLKMDLIGSGVIKMLTMITLLNWLEPEADLSFIWNKTLVTVHIIWLLWYGHRGCDQSTSMEHHWLDKLTWLDLT